MIEGRLGSLADRREYVPDTPPPGNVQPDGKVLILRTGLRLPESLDFESWERTGKRIAGIFDMSAWCLGDWMVYGAAHYADRYRIAAEATGLEYGTLRNYASISRRFELSRRRDKLSFQHHAEVASMSLAEQDMWLDRAMEHGWSRGDLRRNLRVRRDGLAGVDQEDTDARLNISSDQIGNWRAAADRSGKALEEWVIATLNWAAAEALDDAVVDS